MKALILLILVCVIFSNAQRAYIVTNTYSGGNCTSYPTSIRVQYGYVLDCIAYGCSCPNGICSTTECFGNYNLPAGYSGYTTYTDANCTQISTIQAYQTGVCSFDSPNNAKASCDAQGQNVSISTFAGNDTLCASAPSFQSNLSTTNCVNFQKGFCSNATIAPQPTPSPAPSPSNITYVLQSAYSGNSCVGDPVSVALYIASASFPCTPSVCACSNGFCRTTSCVSGYTLPAGYSGSVRYSNQNCGTPGNLVAYKNGVCSVLAPSGQQTALSVKSTCFSQNQTNIFQSFTTTIDCSGPANTGINVMSFQCYNNGVVTSQRTFCGDSITIGTSTPSPTSTVQPTATPSPTNKPSSSSVLLVSLSSIFLVLAFI